MSAIDTLASELKKLITESENRKPTGYYTTATVVRIEDDIAWVHIPGGVDETPIKKTIDSKAGDEIRVRVEGGSAWIAGNDTSPPTDDTMAIVADGKATDAQAQAANATFFATEAQLQADRAKGAANEASVQARQANESASEANEFAINASNKANEATASATEANSAANTAAYHLTEVEKVVDVINWITEHGEYSLTDDTTIIEGKWYFKRTNDGAYVVEEPISNPHNEGFYELASVDTAVSNYVNTHLYLDNDGLYVRMNNDQGAKIKITGTGISLIDSNGNVIAQYSDIVILGDPDGPHIELSPIYGLGFFQTTRQEDYSGAPINRIAYIQNDRLFIKSATLTNNLRIGNFRWVVLDHRISLKYDPIVNQ